jgi:hypothetical protein
MHNMAILCIGLQPLWLSYKIQKNRAAPRGMVEWQSRDVCSCFILLRLSINSSFALYREWKSTNTLSPLFSEVELCNSLYELASFKHPQLMYSSLRP